MQLLTNEFQLLGQTESFEVSSPGVYIGLLSTASTLQTIVYSNISSFKSMSRGDTTTNRINARIHVLICKNAVYGIVAANVATLDNRESGKVHKEFFT